MKIQSALRIFSPITNSIKIIESDRALLSKVVEVFHFVNETLDKNCQNLETASEDDLRAILQSYVDKRITFCCKSIHYAANLLDPRYRFYF